MQTFSFENIKKNNLPCWDTFLIKHIFVIKSPYLITGIMLILTFKNFNSNPLWLFLSHNQKNNKFSVYLFF